MTVYKHLKRLDRVWDDNPIFFITACTENRNSVLANAVVPAILVEEWTASLERHGWGIGRYVVMPNHVHFFCAPSGANCKTLSGFMQQWKQWTSKRIIRECGILPDDPSRRQQKFVPKINSVAGIADPGLQSVDINKHCPDGPSGLQVKDNIWGSDAVAAIGDRGLESQDKKTHYPDDPSGLHRNRLSSPIWQAQFFDHVLRSQESYSQKWDYVRENPVRAGLVHTAEDWPWQGEIHIL